MKHIVIKNFGPLRNVDIDLSKINLIIGLQSSGKSCMMMIVCHCSWVEKRIALRQSAKEFKDDTSFLDMMTSYYHTKGYVHPDTYIEYSTEFMSFSYDNSNKMFKHKWGKSHWKYKRPKVSYIPAERNMISIVSNWKRLETSYDNILDFKSDWDTARRHTKNESDILGTGISYEYDENSVRDSVITPNGKRLDLTNSSSGMQSLIPQYVCLDYLCNGIYDAEKSWNDKTFSEKQFNANLLDVIYQRNYGKNSLDDMSKSVVVHIEGNDYLFKNEQTATKFVSEANDFLKTNHAEVFLEEPECNLFPPTQLQLVNWILDMASDKKHKNFFFIATHSPYILSYMLQENLEDFRLLLTRPVGDGCYDVLKASEEDIQQIYDNGSDAFFNFESFVD